MPLMFMLLMAAATRLFVAGDLRGIARLRLRAESPLLCVLVLVTLLPPMSDVPLLAAAVRPVWISLMLVLFALCLLNLRTVPGFSLMAIGVLLNVFVVILNGAMPVSSAAVAAAVQVPGYTYGGDAFHLVSSAETRLLLLADVLPLPGPSGIRAILSVGDLVMLVGILTVVLRSPKSVPGRTPASSPGPNGGCLDSD